MSERKCQRETDRETEVTDHTFPQHKVARHRQSNRATEVTAHTLKQHKVTERERDRQAERERGDRQYLQTA